MKQHEKKEQCVIITSHIHGKIRDMVYPDDAYVICADGGWQLAEAEGIVPDLVIGDFDSATAKPPADIETKQLPSYKDETDTKECIDAAIEKGYASMLILGGLGGREDHSIANIQNLVAAGKKGISVMMMDEQNVVMALIDDEVRLPKMEGYKISLFSFSDVCEGVSVDGLEYPLIGADLSSDNPIGVSNEFVDDEAYIQVKHGILLIMLSKDKK